MNHLPPSFGILLGNICARRIDFLFRHKSEVSESRIINLLERVDQLSRSIIILNNGSN